LIIPLILILLLIIFGLRVPPEINLRCRSQRLYGRTDGDRDQEYICFMGSETLSSTCFILSDESNLPFYSTY